jgi:nucleoside-diphosphate-sugar epimerase
MGSSFPVKNVLVTGSSGQIGRFLVPKLQQRFQVRRLDRLENDSAHIRGDLLDTTVCRQAVAGMDAIVHLAAVNNRWADSFEENTVSTRNLTLAAIQQGVKRFLFFSSINVYGQGPFKQSSKIHLPNRLPIDEAEEVHPEDPYSLSKLSSERELRALCADSHLQVYCLRPAGVWLPGTTRRHSPGPSRILRANDLIEPWIYLDARDLAGAVRAFLLAPRLPHFSVSYLNAADTTRHESTRELFSRFFPEWVDRLGPEIRGNRSWFSCRATADLNWRPIHTWRTPLKSLRYALRRFLPYSTQPASREPDRQR